ncbi:MAG: TonB-dependent receptor [Gammaproteobacteria bacterium]
MKKISRTASIGATACAICAASAAAAQETQKPSEEVLVTGIRESVSRAIDDKRSLDLIADVITAEDVGKFPDKNIAEALQRVTGVQITRDANEGKHVNVRGLPSEFNHTLLNGQAVTSASDNQIVQGADRNFDFSLLPPDFISALEVYKTPRADLEEGAISATINLRTLRPLDLEGRRLAFSAEAQQYDLKDESEPNVSALYSDQFADGRFGLTLGGALDRRFFQGQSADTAQLDAVTIGGERFLMLNNNSINFNDQLRDTRTYYGALQFQPIESFTASLVSLNADFEGDSISGGFAVRPVFSFNPATFDFEADAENVLTRVVGDDIFVGTGNFHQLDDGKLNHHTLDLHWELERWDVRNQLTSSKSTTHSEEIGFDLLRAGVFRFGTAVSGGYQTIPGQPVASFVIDPTFDVSDPDSYLNGFIGGNVLDRSDDLWSEQLDVTYRFNEGGILESLKAGVRYADRERENAAFFLLDLTQRGTNISEFADSSPVRGLLADYDGDAFLPGDPPYFNSQLYLDAFFNGSYDQWANAATTRRQLNPSNQYTIKEKTTATYLMANYRFDTARPIHGNIGVRVIRTEQAVTNTAVDFDGIQFIEPPPAPPAPAVIVPAGEVQTFTRDYTDYLPSLNVIVDLRDDLLLRFAAAKVLSRPTLESLVPRFSVSVNPDVVSGGNPDLDPFRADQYDLSLEWYFREGALLSAALYYKDIESFIQQGVRDFDIQGRTFTRLLPVNGTGGYVQGAEVGFTHLFDFLPGFWSGFGIQTNFTYADGEVDADPVNNVPAHDFSGLSELTYNIVAFYENYGASVRVAYNTRDPFLSDPDIRGQGTSGAHGTRFSTLDFQAGYDIGEHVNIYLEGNNLLEEEAVSTMQVIDGGSTPYPLSWSVGDRRLAVGIRVKF